MWRLFVCVSLVLVGCAPRQKKIVYPPLPTRGPPLERLVAPAVQPTFVDARAIAIEYKTLLTTFREWEQIGTNYLVWQTGPSTSKAIILTFPSESGIRYHVEGKHIGLQGTQFDQDGVKGCSWHVRSLPFTGTGELMSITNGVTGTEFFRVRKLD